MIIAGIILLITYIMLVIDKIPRVTIVMFWAAITLALGLLPHKKAFEHIDFGVIFLLVSMMIIVHIASRSGMFKWLAIEILKFTKGKPKLILISLAAFTAITSAFLDNVTTVFLVIPITFIIAKELNITPVPFFITEILASNIGGAATLIGDPPNIIIGSAAGLSFMDFVRELTPVITIIFIISILVLLYLFRNDLKTSPEKMQHVADLDNSHSIKDFPLMIRSIIVLTLVIAGFILQELIHIEPYIVALLGASILLMFETPKQIIHDVDWMTIFFFMGLFIVIGGFVETGGIKYLAQQLLNVTKGDLKLTSTLILWLSGSLSAIIDNIPYTITMTPMIKELQGSMNVQPLWWALSLGACLGGNATIIGAAANVIVIEAANASGHKISFLEFAKYGLLITFISLLISNAYIYFRFLI